MYHVFLFVADINFDNNININLLASLIYNYKQALIKLMHRDYNECLPSTLCSSIIQKKNIGVFIQSTSLSCITSFLFKIFDFSTKC